MKLRVFSDYAALCNGVANEVFTQLKRKPTSVLVFPTGNTPLGLFKLLVDSHRNRNADFSKAHVVILDEYADLALGDSRSLTDWLNRELLMPLGFDALRIHGFEKGTTAMEDRIKQLGGLDLIILGLGPNGHLGFNEPGSTSNSRTRRIKLTRETITSNAAYWGAEDQVPRWGDTLGLGTIAEAQSIILMVSGPAKAKILQQTLQSPISTDIPSTILRSCKQSTIYAACPAVHDSGA